MVYCLEGTLLTSVGDEVRDLKPGEWGYSPRGVTHGFSNPHDRAARVLVVLTPTSVHSIFAMSPRPSASRAVPTPRKWPT
jgi:quercetin dioxygenase-like cupin family protein